VRRLKSIIPLRDDLLGHTVRSSRSSYEFKIFSSLGLENNAAGHRECVPHDPPFNPAVVVSKRTGWTLKHYLLSYPVGLERVVFATF
jgi:hypothetical protein